jgi:hypothetical protein
VAWDEACDFARPADLPPPARVPPPAPRELDRASGLVLEPERPPDRAAVLLDDRADDADRLVPPDFEPPERAPDDDDRDFEPPDRAPDDDADDRDLEPELPFRFAVAMSHLFRSKCSSP